MHKFSIGDVVTFQTHPFCAITTNIIISGEYQMVPPLMIVIEIIEHSVIKSEKDRFDKYKCLWFSTKENQYKENYFPEPELKAIHFNKETDVPDITIGNLVTLLTMPIELGKRRSFLNTHSEQVTNKVTSSITGLLTFVSPVMTVIEITSFDPQRDKKTSPDIKQKKIYPVKIAKCKWYDAVSEKFSERMIPVNALSCLPPVPVDLLTLMETSIYENAFFRLDNSIIRPIQIFNRCGSYYLSCFDYILQQTITIPFAQIKNLKELKNPFKAHSPIIKKKGRKGKETLKLTFGVEDLLTVAQGRNKRNYITIKYRDNFDLVTHRTISNYELIMGKDQLGKSKALIQYVSAYCHLRNAQRNFRLASIQEASELNLNF